MEEELIGRDVIVYSRYLFAVPVRGYITAISGKDGAYQVSFYTNNPGGPNVINHNGKYFHSEQCRVCPTKRVKPIMSLVPTEEILKELSTRLNRKGVLQYENL